MARYIIIDSGEIYNPNRRKYLKPFKHRGGYLQVDLFIDGKKERHYVHRLVAEKFIPNPNNKKHVNHKNGNKKDNRAANLEWATASENEKHAWGTGLKDPAKYNFKRKLSLPMIKEIKEKLRTKKGRWIAKEYGVSEQTVSRVKHG